jgi:signal recognition particle subunit SRP54
MYAKQGQHPLLAAADTYRPAAIEQLKTLGAQINVPVVGDASMKPLEICRQAREDAAARGLTPLILDTAGRLHIDEAMLDEVRAIRGELKPHHILLVVDAMTGQDAVTVAEKFKEAVGIDALIFTKMDGDARGGAALSVREVTGRPIAFVGVGEKTDALEPFHPDRLASRILGMGDVLSLVEKAQEAVDQKTAEEMVRKLREDTFSLDDFRQQLKQVRQMGPLDQVLGMIPGLGKMMKGGASDLAGEQKDLDRFDAIISSMTPAERTHPEVINGSRRQRIARGSGTTVQDVNRLLKQHAQLRKMMKQFKGMEGKLGRMKGLPGFPSLRG